MSPATPGIAISLDALLKLIQLAVALAVLVGGLVEVWTGAVRSRLKRERVLEAHADEAAILVEQRGDAWEVAG